MAKTLIHDYFSEQEKYQEKYGENTVLMMQVGSFYELYAVSPKEEAHLGRVAKIMGIRVTRKNNKNGEVVATHGNPYMAGITDIAFSKYKNMLIQAGYTVVRMDQNMNETVSQGRKKLVKREVSRIYSSGTQLEESDIYAQPGDIKYLVSLYLEGFEEGSMYHLGLSIFDAMTGDSFVYECRDRVQLGNKHSKSHEIGALADAYRILYSYPPTELLIHTHNVSEKIDSILTKLGIHSTNCSVHCREPLIAKNKWLDHHHLENYLRPMYRGCCGLHPFDYLGFGLRQHAVVAFSLGLEFLREHDALLTTSLKKPKMLDETLDNGSQTLSVSYQTFQTLDVFSNQKDSLFHILDKTSSALGRRELRHRLNHPVTNQTVLKTRYGQIESLLKLHPDIERKLKCLYDISKYHRKLGLGKIKPFEWSCIHHSNQAILETIEMTRQLPNLECDASQVGNFRTWVSDYTGSFQLDEMVKYQSIQECRESPLQPNQCSEVDTLQKEIQSLNAQLHNLRTFLIPYCLTIKDRQGDTSKWDNAIKLHITEKDGYYFKLTKTRANELRKANLPNYDGNNLIIHIRDKSGESSIQSPLLDTITQKLNTTIGKMRIATMKFYVEKQQAWYIKYEETFGYLEDYIAAVDVAASQAHLTQEYGYTKPQLEKPSPNGGSFLRATQLRHPITERLNQDTLFVPNDVHLGCIPNDSSRKTEHGKIITGLNGVGKSIYIKSVALSILMAQSGFFVPATEFILAPYHSLFTRIGNLDNLFRGQSTFYCEMLELDYILRHSNRNSFVIADELCSGSELYSAQAILAATIKHLAYRNVNFLLTTHFHTPLEDDSIRSIPNIGYYHFKVDYQRADDSSHPEQNSAGTRGRLVYHRLLEKGLGPKIYGIEVARYLVGGYDNTVSDDSGERHDFIHDCYQYREKLMGQSSSIEYKGSKYNQAVEVKCCAICQAQNNLHTHHINEQHCADSHGLIDSHIKKDEKGNLVVLCEAHHHEVHHGNLRIHGWKKSLDEGCILDYTIETPGQDNQVKQEEQANKTNSENNTSSTQYVPEMQNVSNNHQPYPRRYKYSVEQAEIIKSFQSSTFGNVKAAKKQIEETNGFKKISIKTIRAIWNNQYFEECTAGPH